MELLQTCDKKVKGKRKVNRIFTIIIIVVNIIAVTVIVFIIVKVTIVVIVFTSWHT